jgi:glutathione S-transferase
VHPLGKSPVLVTGTGLVLAESAAIATYLLNTYDTESKFHESDIHKDDFYVQESLVSFAGATLGPNGLLQLLLDLITKHTPFPFNYLVGLVTKPAQRHFTAPENGKALTYLERVLGEKDWFGGKDVPGKADFTLSFPLDMMAHRGWVDFEGEFPKLAAWRQRYLDREAWKRGLNKGNGYDLSTF